MADVKLTEDLSIVSKSNIEIEMLGDDLNIIQKLDDEPNDVGGMSSAELKATFDKSGLIIQKYINETLIPEIIAEDATENARQSAEAARAAAETARQEAENSRQSAESTRNESEESRVLAEQSRVSSENNRQDAEAARAAEETERQSAESGRESAERERSSAEQKRLDGEKNRVSNEAARQSAEDQRESAEHSRVAAEHSRVAAEHSRVAAEHSRVAAEQGRLSAEAQRAAAEADRQSKSAAMQVWEDYDSAKAYVPLNKVAWNGSSYICVQPCTGVTPDNGDYWLMIAKRGIDGATVSASGQYGFAVEDGHLILYYTGDTPPDFSIDESGHLILNFDDTHTMDIGAVIGPRGDAGPGVPAGGTAGQVLTKSSSDDYATEWKDAPAGSGSGSGTGGSYTLPIASSTVLGGVKPVAKTDAMTQSVGVDAAGALFTKPGSGGGSADEVLFDITLTEDASVVVSDAISKDDFIEFLSRHNRIDFSYRLVATTDSTITDRGAANFGFYRSDWNQYYIPVLSITNNNASNVVPNNGGEIKVGMGSINHDGPFFRNDFTYGNMVNVNVNVGYSAYWPDEGFPATTLIRANTTTVFGAGSRFRVVGK